MDCAARLTISAYAVQPEKVNTGDVEHGSSSDSARLAGGAVDGLDGHELSRYQFHRQTADPQMAVRISQAAEQFRHDLAIEWLGQTMPNWPSRA